MAGQDKVCQHEEPMEWEVVLSGDERAFHSVRETPGRCQLCGGRVVNKRPESHLH